MIIHIQFLFCYRDHKKRIHEVHLPDQTTNRSGAARSSTATGSTAAKQPRKRKPRDKPPPIPTAPEILPTTTDDDKSATAVDLVAVTAATTQQPAFVHQSVIRGPLSSTAVAAGHNSNSQLHFR